MLVAEAAEAIFLKSILMSHIMPMNPSTRDESNYLFRLRRGFIADFVCCILNALQGGASPVTVE